MLFNNYFCIFNFFLFYFYIIFVFCVTPQPIMSNNLCGSCENPTPNNNNGTKLICSNCKKHFHKRIECSSMNYKTVNDIINRDFEWLCSSCVHEIFPFSSIDTGELIDIFSIYIQDGQPKPTKKTKCNHCSRRVNKDVFVYCKIAPNSIIYLVLIQKVKIFHCQKNGTAINVA